MKSQLLKPVAAVIILAAAFLSLTLLNKTIPQVYAVEQTVKAMQAVKNLKVPLKNGSVRMNMTMIVNPQTGYADRIRMDGDSGNVTITIPGQTYVYDRQKNQVTLTDQELMRNDLNFHDVINSLIEQTHATDGRVEIINRFSDLTQKEMITVTLIRSDESVAGEFIINPESCLPAYIGIDSGGNINYMGPFEYNVEIAPEMFEFIVPDGAEVIDQRSEASKDAGPDASEDSEFSIQQTAQVLQSIRNGHGILIDRQGRRVEIWAELDPQTGQITRGRMEYEDGGLYIMADGKTYFEDDDIKGIQDGFFFKSNIMYNNFITSAVSRIGDQDVMDVKKVYSTEFDKEVFAVSVQCPWIHLDAVIDPDTKRPIKLAVPFTTDQAEILDHTELIEYDINLPEDFFNIETGPDVLILGSQLDRQFANDPAYGVSYDESEDLQQVCQQVAERYLQAKIDIDVEQIKQLHPVHISRYGSCKMIEKAILQEVTRNGHVAEICSFKPAYEYRPQQMMVPCRIILDHSGQRWEALVGVIVYLRDRQGQKSAVVTGYFPKLAAELSISPDNATLDNVTYDESAAGSLMRHWLLLGPLPFDSRQARDAFEAEWIDPADFAPTVHIDGTDYSWQLLSSELGCIDLTRLFEDIPGIVYARVRIDMPQEKQVVLAVGSDDGVKVWLNGELVHENWITRGVTIDEDPIPVTLKQGLNDLVLKIQNQGGGPWGFCCRLPAEE